MQISDDSRRGRPGPEEGSPELFRREALESLASGRRTEGELLRISPAWTGWAYRLLVAFFAVAAVFLVTGRVAEYAEGPAVVRVEGRVEITAMTGGTVTAVAVSTGQEVLAGQELVRFYDAAEDAELERLRREFDLQLVAYLKEPAEPGLRQPLIALRTQKELAEARVEQRIVRAPRDGRIGDLHVRPGQVVLAGEPILSLIGPAPSASLIAVLPGHFRPMLRPGMPLTLELAGYRYVYETAEIESIGDEVIGAQALRRYLGQTIADTVEPPGPAVVVRARMPGPTFTSGSRAYTLHDGMHGRAEVRVRSERILVALVPALRALFGRRDG